LNLLRLPEALARVRVNHGITLYASGKTFALTWSERWQKKSRMDDRKHVFDEFSKLCLQLKIEFDLFCGLFDRGPAQQDLLHRTAPFLFGEVSAALHHQVYLGFCRITDRARSGKYANLTTNYIVEELCWTEEVRAELAGVNKRLMAFRKFVEPARSKRIAHTDFTTHIERHSLGGYPTGSDDNFFKDLEEFLTIAFREIVGGTILLSMATPNDTRRLITALMKAELFDQCTECSEIDRMDAIATKRS
jgi:hypothetical protein